MKILVTGSSGFVGKHFVERLIASDHEVWGLDLLGPIRIYRERNFIHHYRADLRDFLRAYATPDHGGWDMIIHCAAVVGGRLHIENHPLDVATDLSIDSELFNWLVQPQNIKTRLIYFSSSAVYPIDMQTKAGYVKLYEGHQPAARSTTIGMPDFTYGWCKLSGEMLAHYAVSKHGADVRIYRPFGGYGEGQDFTYPFPSIVQRVLNGENPVIVWGSGYQMRDFIHIDDVIETVLQSHDKMASGDVLNIGTGIETSFRNLAQTVADVLNVKIEIVADKTKPEGVFSRVADVRKMHKFHVPKISLETGILRVAKELAKRKEVA